jgi:hypothetical protein
MTLQDAAPEESMSAGRDAVDEVLDELHEIRRAISAQFDDDPRKYIAYLQEVHQQLLREGWVEAPPRPKQGKSAA